MANDCQKNDYKPFYQVYPGYIFPNKSSYKCKYAFHDPRRVNEIDIAYVLRVARLDVNWRYFAVYFIQLAAFAKTL